MKTIALTDLENCTLSQVLSEINMKMAPDKEFNGAYTDGGEIVLLLSLSEIKALRRIIQKLFN